jgi:hypothetical protein
MEQADNKRKLSVMSSELERFEKALRSLSSSLAFNQGSEFNLRSVERDITHHPVLEKIDMKPLLSFLRDYTELRQAIDTGSVRLREIGL